MKVSDENASPPITAGAKLACDWCAILDVRRLQVNGFGNAQAGRIAAGQDRSMVNGGTQESK